MHCLLFLDYLVGVVFEKIMIKNNTDTKKQFGINAFTLENIIYVCPVAKEFSCKPTDRSLLAMQFFPYEFSNVQHIKMGGTIQYLFPNWGTAKHRVTK